jgi:uncharacterized 2Fe-2S/4Fe-4S cluster protein (DUF4445 family)
VKQMLETNKLTEDTNTTLFIVTFATLGFQQHFGWSCVPDDFGCIPKASAEISLEKGLINAFFGIGLQSGLSSIITSRINLAAA